MNVRKFTLITGASSGIGAKTAETLVRSSDIILWGQNTERLQKVKESCSAIRNCTSIKNKFIEPLIVSHDLSNVDGIQEALAKILQQNNKNNERFVIDKFVHCAGSCSIAGVKSYNHEQILEMMNINLFSAMEITKHLVRKKTNNKALENVVFISSTYAKCGGAGHSFYGATKAAINSYMKSVAKELAPKVRCNSILPGGVKTAMSQSFFANEELVKQGLKDYPLGFGETSDIANMIEFLLCEKARWITGQELIVDGGFSI